MMNMTRVWAMPNKNTFSIKPIRELIERHLTDGLWCDPFVRVSPFKDRMTVSNDMNEEFSATHHMEALDFLRSLKTGCFDGVLFDPPYSNEQRSRAYGEAQRKVTSHVTSAGWAAERKAECARILKPGGIAISFGWTTAGLGKKNGMEAIEYMAVCHGADHYDTLVTVERKLEGAKDAD